VLPACEKDCFPFRSTADLSDSFLGGALRRLPEVRASILTTANSNLLGAASAAIQTRSSKLRKELGFGDLVLAQVLAVVVPDFFGTAVKAGPSHVVLWLIAILSFFIPQALLVAHLNRLAPLEGGLYEWARLAFGDRIGFLVAWNLWLFGTLYTAVVGLIATTFLAYAVGTSTSWVVSSGPSILIASTVCIIALIFIARVGLKFGKWLNNLGSVCILVTLGVLIVMPFAAVWRGSPHEYHPLRLVAPTLSLFSLSVFTKMTFGALTSFEYVAIFAGESRNPARDYVRSIRVSAPVIALFYILGTSAILAFVSPDAVNVIGSVPQALSLGAGSFGIAKFVAPFAILLLFVNYISNFSLNFNANTRLPMVAGWDHLLPEWFTRLHPKHRTPVNSIFFVGGVALAAAIIALAGVGPDEAYELLLNWSFTFYGLTYLVMFAIPLMARRESGLRPRLWLRLASASGFLVTFLFVLLSVFPIISVKSVFAYAIKSVAVLIGANAFGFLFYHFGKRGRVERV
jgi:glutamate:GABA antiporter